MTRTCFRHSLHFSAFAAVVAWATPAWADFGFPPPSNLTTMQGLIRGVVVTLVVEGAIVVWYCRRRELPLPRFVIALLVGNAITLPVVFVISFLGWFLLAFFGVLVFLMAELMAAAVEGLIYSATRKLELRDAMRLALLANAVTAGLGVIDQAIHFQTKAGPPFRGELASVETGGNYPPVNERMLAGARLTNRTGGPAFDDLTWQFTETRFVIAAGPSGLPEDLIAALAPSVDPATAKRIEGTWRLDGETIVFTDISADGEALEQPPRRLPTFNTGVLRIETDAEQYVFHRR